MLLIMICGPDYLAWIVHGHNNYYYCRYIGKHVAEVDRRLVSIAPPQSIERAPRSIEKHRQYWKGIYDFIIILIMLK